MKNSLSAKRGVMILTLLVGILAVGCLARVTYIAVIRGDEYKAKAEQQQLSVTTVSAMRGTIYDCNNNVLAQSASVWLVYVNPSKIDNDNLDTICTNLAAILELDAEALRTKILANADYGYLEIAGQVEYEAKTKVQAFVYENELYGIVSIDPDTIRYYPNGNLCSTILGFTGKDDIGLAGLEYYYNDEMTGMDGRIVTAKDGTQQPMPNQFVTTYDAVQGDNLVLTIDSEVQTILENALETALVENEAKNVYGIVMDVKTGGILAMANLPDYDPNTPYKINEAVAAGIAELPLEEQDDAFVTAQNNQWKNKAIADFYEPGSVEKVFLVAAAFEEGVVNDNTSYHCTGRIEVVDRSIKDYNPTGHGYETLADLFINSCNTFSVHVGVDKLGTELYYKYFQAFGFTEKTGIDISGEGAPVGGVTYHDPAVSFTISDLASCSFGQSFEITPIQMITAISCVANGGRLMKPYIVAKRVDTDGNTLEETQPTVRRQVISESTASQILGYMEQVVETGTGTNAYVPGYRIAGKTGTSEKLGTEEGVYLASFAGVAPADDPALAVLIIIDEPGGVNYSGGVIAAPVGGEVFERVLPLLGIEPAYSDEELALLSKTTPDVTELETADAVTQLKNEGFKVRIIGEGDLVLGQSPDAGRPITGGGTVVLYTEAGELDETAEVPNFLGLTVDAANAAAAQAGLNLKLNGGALQAADVVAYRQSVEEGARVELGSTITVYFRSNNATDDGYVE